MKQKRRIHGPNGINIEKCYMNKIWEKDPNLFEGKNCSIFFPTSQNKRKSLSKFQVTLKCRQTTFYFALKVSIRMSCPDTISLSTSTTLSPQQGIALSMIIVTWQWLSCSSGCSWILGTAVMSCHSSCRKKITAVKDSGRADVKLKQKRQWALCLLCLNCGHIYTASLLLRRITIQLIGRQAAVDSEQKKITSI